MDADKYQPRDFAWSQRDPRWSWKKIGISGLSIGGYGCATVAANYAANRAWKKLGIPKMTRPGTFVDFCNNNGGYTDNGMIRWTMVDKFTNGCLVYTKEKKGSFVTLAQVRWGALLHWVVLVNGDLCQDPWDAQFKKRLQPKWLATGREIYFKLK